MYLRILTVAMVLIVSENPQATELANVYLSWIKDMCVGLDKPGFDLLESADEAIKFCPYVCTDIDNPEARQNMLLHFNGTLKTSQGLCVSPTISDTINCGTQETLQQHAIEVVATQCTGALEQQWHVESSGTLLHRCFDKILTVSTDVERLFVVGKTHTDEEQFIQVEAKKALPLRRRKRFVEKGFASLLEMGSDLSDPTL